VRFTNYTTRDGLVQDNAAHLADDPDGNLWIGSWRGLMRIRKADLKDHHPGSGGRLPCLTLTVNDGMFSQMCSGGAQSAMVWGAAGDGARVVGEIVGEPNAARCQGPPGGGAVGTGIRRA
jgi:ligand-binding sensor domain-containing protein